MWSWPWIGASAAATPVRAAALEQAQGHGCNNAAGQVEAAKLALAQLAQRRRRTWSGRTPAEALATALPDQRRQAPTALARPACLGFRRDRRDPPPPRVALLTAAA
jgi:hypothetical protein